MPAPLVNIDPESDLMGASKMMRENIVRKLAVVRDKIIYLIITAKEIALRCGEYVDKSIKDIIWWTPHIGVLKGVLRDPRSVGHGDRVKSLHYRLP